MLTMSRIPLPGAYLPTRQSSSYFRDLFHHQQQQSRRESGRGAATAEEVMLVDVEAGDPFLVDSDDNSITLND